MDHTTVLLSSTVINNLCNVVFLFLPLVFRQGPHLRMIFFSLRFLRCEPTILSYLIWFEQKEAVAVPSAATECHRHHWPLPTIRPKCPGLYACAPHLESSRASGAPLLSGRGLQLQLDDERELLRAALRHLEAQLLEAAHLRKEAGEAARQQASGHP